MASLPLLAPAPKARFRGLIVLLFLGYVLLSLLVVEQGRVIASQRSLIKDLFSDSMQLSAMKARAARDGQQQAAPLQNKAGGPKVRRPPAMFSAPL